MSYIVFARKYRPQTFDDIEGQAHVTTTLKNAISQNRVAHAYIFAGPRGVGKTTTARIFAKALDCEKGPTPMPCNKCDLCKEITRGSNLDCLEIDGASNRGIDEIRNLRENVKFAPSRGKFKIYIIDEVHMLTPEAFNALLKTLEEPPPHAKFIFATTQAHKVPATILSRCQRFDFRRIAASGIFKNLKSISESESLKVNDDALMLIAKHCDGSMRDAQVTLDQIMSFAEGTLGAEDVAKILGIVDDEILFGLSGAINEKDASTALRIVDNFVNEGKETLEVVLGLIEHFRNISIAKIGKELNSLIDTSAEKIKAYAEEAKKFTIEEVLYIIYTLSNTIDFIRKSNLSKIPLEAALIKLTRTGSIMSMAEIIDRVDALGKNCAQESAGYKSSAAGQRVDKAKAVSSTPAVDASTKPGIDPEHSRGIERPKGVAAPTEEAPPERRENKEDLNEALSSWESIVNYVKTKKISIGSYLQEGYPVSLENGILTIGFSKEFQFHKEMLGSLENRRLIEEAVRIILNLGLKVNLIATETPTSQGRNGGSYDLSGGSGAAKEDIDPIVKTALDIFDGEMKIARDPRPKQK
ncbi:MAG: DNA polymerase III subunit gamma/tau [Candidatus Omnitrophota bacterium]|nr:DNA polymerase III subunit gamma/tau [Candidatus Omnitrophota bacterium]